MPDMITARAATDLQRSPYERLAIRFPARRLILAGAALAFVALVGCGSSTAIPPEVPAVTTAVVTASAKSAAPTPDVAFITPIPPSFPTPGNLLAATVSPSQLPPPTASPSVTAVPTPTISTRASAVAQPTAMKPVTPTESPSPVPPTSTSPPVLSTSTATPDPVQPTATRLATASPVSLPTPTPTVVHVEITCIFFDGAVPTSESDEYVEILNAGGAAADIGGWTLTDIADGTPVFAFPATIIPPGESIRVYTDEIHPESGGFSFGRGASIWNNGSPDAAGLHDLSGALVSRKSYPPGCQTPP